MEGTHLTDNGGEALTINVLHCIVVDAALASDSVDRHDIRVMQARGRLRLILKALELARVKNRCQGENLDRHLAPQRDLLRLVDDSHAAATDLADDPVVAQDTIDDGPREPGCVSVWRAG